MLDGLSVTNFKSLRQITLSFPRLTLLLGPNSSGKSSVFQALLAIKQTFESRNVFVPLVLSGRYTQLGSFENVVYGNDLSEKVAVEVKVRIPPRFRLGRSRPLDSFLTSKEIDLSAVTVRFALDYVKSTRRIKLSETHVRDARDLDIISIRGKNHATVGQGHRVSNLRKKSQDRKRQICGDVNLFPP